MIALATSYTGTIACGGQSGEQESSKHLSKRAYLTLSQKTVFALTVPIDKVCLDG